VLSRTQAQLKRSSHSIDNTTEWRQFFD